MSNVFPLCEISRLCCDGVFPESGLTISSKGLFDPAVGVGADEFTFSEVSERLVAMIRIEGKQIDNKDTELAGNIRDKEMFQSPVFCIFYSNKPLCLLHVQMFHLYE